MDFSFVSPHPVSAARLQVACATDRYKMFSHRAQRSLAAERRDRQGAWQEPAWGRERQRRDTSPCATQRAVQLQHNLHALGGALPRRTVHRCAHTHWVLTHRGAHRQQSPTNHPTNGAVPTQPQGTRQPFCSGESSSTFTTNQPPHHSAFCVGFFFSPPFSPSFKGSS